MAKTARAAAAASLSDAAVSWQHLAAWIAARGGDVSRVSMATVGGMRGLVATRDIAQGEAIVEVPLAAAIELSGPRADAGDPGVPAVALLERRREGGPEATPYFDLLPLAGARDFASVPDTWTSEELEMTQCPPIIRKTRARQALVADKAAEAGLPKADVQWALCTVAQRSFTVLNPVSGLSRLLLPGIDLFNHDADSLHRFRVRWQLADGFDGVFKVVAGAAVAKGEEIRICYGGSPYRADGCGGDCVGDFALTNEAYLQRYGFVDKSLGTTMVDGKWLASEEATEVRESLAQTSAEADEEALVAASAGDGASASIGTRTALDFRLHLKRALAAQRVVEEAKDVTKVPEPEPLEEKS